MARGKLGKATPQQIAQAWSNGYSASGPTIQAGVQNPKADPTAAAIAQQNTMVANWNQAIQGGAWAAGLRASGLQGWQSGMIQKTIPGLGTRAQAGMGHYAAFWQQWSGFLLQARNSLPARGTYEQNKQRSAAMQDAMHSARGKYRHLWRGGAQVGGGNF